MSANYTLWPSGFGESESLAPAGPPKPARGVMRPKHPVRVEPFADRSNVTNVVSNSGPCTPVAGNGRFAAKDARQKLIQDFKGRASARGEAFSGKEGLEAMMVSVQQKNEFALTVEDATEKALKMLDHWLDERIIRPVVPECDDDDDKPRFVHNKKVFYLVNPDEEHRVLMMTPSKPSVRRASSISRERPRSAIRKSSFKRIFGLGSSTDHDRHTPSLDIEPPVNHVESERATYGTIGRVVQNLFGTSEAEVTPVVAKTENLSDDVALFEVVLRRLLVEVDVPVLDEILNLKDSGPDVRSRSVSLLSSILKRIGITSSPGQNALANNFINAQTLESNTLFRHRPVVADWFRAALKCCPSHVVGRPGTVSPKEQLHIWSNAVLKAIEERYSGLTSRGQNPLIPVEYEPLLSSLIEQLIGNPHKAAKKDRALRYLWLLVPLKLRTELDLLINVFTCCDGTDAVFSIKNPFFHTTGYEDNFSMCLVAVIKFIFPQGKISSLDQSSIIENLINARRKQDLNQIDEGLLVEMNALQNGTAISPFKYCQQEIPAIDDKDKWIVDMITGIIESVLWTGAQKEEKIKECKKSYPKIMAAHFYNY